MDKNFQGLSWSSVNYLIFNFTPEGVPTDTDADKVLCLDTFFSIPYSTKLPNVPPLKQHTFKPITLM